MLILVFLYAYFSGGFYETGVADPEWAKFSIRIPRYLRYMDIKTNYFNMTQIEADSANGIDLCLRNFAIAARSAD